jgi:SAM-dependent methyltransferase
MQKIWNQISPWGKILIVVVLLMSLFFLFSSSSPSSYKRETFINNQNFLLKEGEGVYDGFYSQIYDQLVYNQALDDYEVGAIINNTTPNEQSIILDVGSGTGHIVKSLTDKGIPAKGIDISQSMVTQAQAAYPDLDFARADALRASTFSPNSFTHILCLYFTIYYMEDKARFFKNCYRWLMPGGFLVVHLVDREMFDPIIPPANPLALLTPQRYAKERITRSKVVFDQFKYQSNFILGGVDGGDAQFIEKFHFNDGRVRKNVHQMYMPSEDAIVRMAQDAGFIVQGEIDLIKAGYEYNQLVIFMKPSTG